MKTKYIINTKNTLLLFSLLIFLAANMSSCKKKEGCTDPAAINYDPDADKNDGSCTYDTPVASTAKLTFTFSHNFDGTSVTASNFDSIQYTNLNGEQLSISKLRYLISDVRLYKTNGDSIVIEGYQFVDLTNSTSLTYTPTNNIPFGTYTGISFNFGFDSLDNISNDYPDLNIATWNWPDMLGGGYHFMQLEGKYINTSASVVNYAYHHGTAKVSAGVFEQNYFKADLGGITLSSNAAIEIKMNIAEWFKNPNTWDLNTYFAMLMPNYNAQIMMKQNGPSVFSLGTVTQ